ncbi:hypothetical protein TSUD_173520 [Trifolium subterraneum]|nr:hypothetical protein TSUD_173520 [Trifolium subterraneum]
MSTPFCFRDMPQLRVFRLKLIYDYRQILYLRGPINSTIQWLNYVVQRRVECLDLRLRNTFWEAENLVLNLPISILTCKTLVVLKLCGYGVQQGSSSVLLPSLKTLHLKLVWFPKLRDLMLFLTGCPVLQDLYTYDLYFDSEESLTCNEWNTFTLSNLTRADIDCFHSHLTLKAVQNVLFLRFEIDQVYANDFVPTFHNLTQLELLYLNYSSRFLLEVLKHCPVLQKLELDQANVGEETQTRKDDKENWIDPDVVPQCLSLHLRTCILFNFLGLEGELLLAGYILKNANVLQTMSIWNCGQRNIKRLLSSCAKASATFAGFGGLNLNFDGHKLCLVTDRISALSDSVICHILSFLPTNQSAATSILSKRWNPLWLSVLALDVDDQNFTNFNTFKHFVSSLICRHGSVLPIQSFHLKCGVICCINLTVLELKRLSLKNSPYRYHVPAFINLTYMEIVFELSFDWPEKWTGWSKCYNIVLNFKIILSYLLKMLRLMRPRASPNLLLLRSRGRPNKDPFLLLNLARHALHVLLNTSQQSISTSLGRWNRSSKIAAPFIQGAILIRAPAVTTPSGERLLLDATVRRFSGHPPLLINRLDQ